MIGNPGARMTGFQDTLLHVAEEKKVSPMKKIRQAKAELWLLGAMERRRLSSYKKGFLLLHKGKGLCMWKSPWRRPQKNTNFATGEEYIQGQTNTCRVLRTRCLAASNRRSCSMEEVDFRYTLMAQDKGTGNLENSLGCLGEGHKDYRTMSSLR